MESDPQRTIVGARTSIRTNDMMNVFSEIPLLMKIKKPISNAKIGFKLMPFDNPSFPNLTRIGGFASSGYPDFAVSLTT